LFAKSCTFILPNTLWKKYQDGVENDLLKECREFCQKFESANISCAIIKEQEIVRLCNLVNNPAYMNN